MSSYPSAERQSCGYAIRYIKTLLDSDAIRDHGTDAVLLAIFIASREDKLHYRTPPKFWRSELMDRFGNGSPKGFIRIRQKAVDAGLLFHVEGTRSRPGLYWTTVPDWLRPRFEAFRKRNGSKPKRSENGTDSGTDSGTESGTLSIPMTHDPKPNKRGARSRFIPPTVDEVRAYCHERRNGINPQGFVDYYEANGWKQSNGNRISNWQAAVRTWEVRQSEFGKTTATTTTTPQRQIQPMRKAP